MALALARPWPPPVGASTARHSNAVGYGLPVGPGPPAHRYADGQPELRSVLRHRKPRCRPTLHRPHALHDTPRDATTPVYGPLPLPLALGGDGFYCSARRGVRGRPDPPYASGPAPGPPVRLWPGPGCGSGPPLAPAPSERQRRGIPTPLGTVCRSARDPPCRPPVQTPATGRGGSPATRSGALGIGGNRGGARRPAGPA